MATSESEAGVIFSLPSALHGGEGKVCYPINGMAVANNQSHHDWLTGYMVLSARLCRPTLGLRESEEHENPHN